MIGVKVVSKFTAVVECERSLARGGLGVDKPVAISAFRTFPVDVARSRDDNLFSPRASFGHLVDVTDDLVPPTSRLCRILECDPASGSRNSYVSVRLPLYASSLGVNTVRGQSGITGLQPLEKLIAEAVKLGVRKLLQARERGHPDDPSRLEITKNELSTYTLMAHLLQAPRWRASHEKRWRLRARARPSCSRFFGPPQLRVCHERRHISDTSAIE